MTATPHEYSEEEALDVSAPEPSDDALLAQFLATEDDEAFERLLRRHGPMVMGLLRRLGLQEADAEDAFQATFLTLARKAAAIANRDAVASWLYKVAYRIGLEQRERLKKRHTAEHALTGAETAPMDRNFAEFWRLLDAEVVQLPEKYRVAFVHCHLQGLTLNEAAERSGCPAGTVASRLARACLLLRTRLAKRGLVITGAVFLLYLSQAPFAQAAVPPALTRYTMRTAVRFRQAAIAGALSAEVIALSDLAIHALFLAQVRAAVLLTLVTLLGATVLGVGLATALGPSRVEDGTPQIDWLVQWGTVVDPDADCRFRATRDTLTVQMPGGPHVLADPGWRNAPRVIHNVRGNFMVQVKIAQTDFPRPPTAFTRDLFVANGGAGFLNNAALQGAGIIVRQDDDMFLKIVYGSLARDKGREGYLAWQACFHGMTSYRGAVLPATVDNQYLRVQRLGPHLFSSASADGERWQYLPTVTEELADALQVGPIAEQNTTEAFEVIFSQHQLRRFHSGNNPQPAGKPGPVAVQGCARCHNEAVPKVDLDFNFQWKQSP